MSCFLNIHSDLTFPKLLQFQIFSIWCICSNVNKRWFWDLQIIAKYSVLFTLFHNVPLFFWTGVVMIGLICMRSWFLERIIYNRSLKSMFDWHVTSYILWSWHECLLWISFRLAQSAQSTHLHRVFVPCATSGCVTSAPMCTCIREPLLLPNTQIHTNSRGPVPISVLTFTREAPAPCLLRDKARDLSWNLKALHSGCLCLTLF